MKKLFLSFVVFSVLLLIGCQENSITDPVSSQTVNKDQNTEIIRGSIPLSGLLANPGGGFNSFLEVDGQINYTHEKVYVNVPPLPRYDISLKLDVNATLTDPQSPRQNYLTISSKSEDVFHISQEGMYVLEKAFPVQGEDGMVLVCRFLVTTDGVALNDKWLTYVDGGGTLNKVAPNNIIMPPVKTNEHE